MPKEKIIDFLDKVSKEKIQPYIDKSYQELADYVNAYEQKMIMKRENLVDTMINVTKKRYCMSVYDSEGVRYETPQLKIMGLQMVKSSTPGAIREILKESLEIILRRTESDIQDFVEKHKNDFNDLPIEDIAFPRGISDLEKWESETTIYKKGTPIHVRGALLYNNFVRKNNLTSKYPLIKSGDKIKFVYLKVPNPLREDCIAFIDELPKELSLTEYVNYPIMFEKTFQDAVQNILDSMGWSAERKANLDDFFA